MAREKGQKSRRTKKSRSSGAARKNADKHASVWASRLRAVTILLAVGAVAIFLGYTVGNYAIQWFFGAEDDPAIVASQGNGRESTGGVVTGPGSGSEPAAPSQILNAKDTVQETHASSTVDAGSSSAESSPTTAPTTEASAPPSSANEVLYRVRVGTFATREAAEPQLHTLTEIGYPDAYVVKSDDGAAYHIQVGAFSTLQSASDVDEQLGAAGFAVYIETVQRR